MEEATANPQLLLLTMQWPKRGKRTTVNAPRLLLAMQRPKRGERATRTTVNHRDGTPRTCTGWINPHAVIAGDVSSHYLSLATVGRASRIITIPRVFLWTSARRTRSRSSAFPGFSSGPLQGGQIPGFRFFLTISPLPEHARKHIPSRACHPLCRKPRQRWRGFSSIDVGDAGDVSGILVCRVTSMDVGDAGDIAGVLVCRVTGWGGSILRVTLQGVTHLGTSG